jgi:hypothetical protein
VIIAGEVILAGGVLIAGEMIIAGKNTGKKHHLRQGLLFQHGSA